MFSRVLILSDTHFTRVDDPLLARVIATARALDLRGPQDAVVMAGDLFELYVGNKPYFRQQFQAWHVLVQEWIERGVRVDCIEGNHDFQLEGVFPAAVALHGQELELPLQGGARLWVEHGDLVDSDDIGYRVLRALLRSLPMRTFIKLAPDAWVAAIGTRMSAMSQARHPREPDLAQRDRLRAAYHARAAEHFAAGFGYVVMGHCHDLDEYRTSSGHYLNMGLPRTHGQIVLWEAGKLERLALASRADL